MTETISIENFDPGKYEQGYSYSYFVPTKVNGQWEWASGALNELLEKASIKIGELNSFARLVPNIDLFIHLHITKEAVISSRIEGTQTEMDEALLPEDEISPEKRNDWLEVQNYTEAMNAAIERLTTLPLSNRLLKQTHEILLSSVRGKHKLPGEFRKSQNWIGGSTLADAKFIPPSHEHVPELMGDLELFLHNPSIHVPALIRIGIAHYQFETIHPFLDGNGRIGRLLITLYLVSEKILEQPLLYLSVFFEKNKRLYYDNLTDVREAGDMLGWLKYFLVGVEQTATQAVDTLTKILSLKKQVEDTIYTNFGRRAPVGLILLNKLFEQPFVTIKDVESITGLSTRASGNLVRSFLEQKILTEVTGNRRNRFYTFQPYLDLF